MKRNIVLVGILLVLIVFVCFSSGNCFEDVWHDSALPVDEAQNPVTDSGSRKRFESSPKISQHENQEVKTREIRVVDLLSARPISGAAVRLGDSEFETDLNGLVSLGRIAGECSDISVALPQSYGLRPPLKQRVKWGAGEEVIVVSVNATAGIRWFWDSQEAASIRFEVSPFPRYESVAREYVLSESEARQLRMNLANPAAYARHLPGEFVWPSEEGKSSRVQSTTYVKCVGRTSIRVLPMGTSKIPLSIFSTVENLVPGEITNVAVSTMRRPRVAGIVVDQYGNPVMNAAVTVACRWFFDESYPIPRFGSEPGGSALFAWAVKGTYGMNARVYLTRQTDKNGRFSLSMPFTGRCALWVDAHQFLQGYRELRIVGALSDHEGIKVVLNYRTHEPQRTILLKNPDGTPAVGVQVKLNHVEPLHDFNRAYSLVSDRLGRLDMTGISADNKMIGVANRKEVFRFRNHDQTEITLGRHLGKSRN